MSEQVAGDSFKLYDFFKKLTLPTIINGPGAPQFILDGEPSSITPLLQEPETFPSFQEVTSINKMDDEIKAFFSARQRGEELVAHLELLTLPIQAEVAMRHPEINTTFRDFNPLIINGFNDFLTFLHRFIFQSICQILHVWDTDSEPDNAHDWIFTNVDSASDWSNVRNSGAETRCGTIQNFIVLHSRAAGATTTISKPKAASLVILPFMPWEFTEKDFINLAMPNQILDYRESDWVTKSDLIWTYLYNICSNFNCYFFVITSYQQWCFGYFTSDWSEIYFSTPFNFDNPEISIIGALICWIQNSSEVDSKIRNSSEHEHETTQTTFEKNLFTPPKSAESQPSPPQAKQSWFNEKILQFASFDTWKWMQSPIGRRHVRFETANTQVRRFRELQRIEDQVRAKNKKKRYAQLKRQLHEAKEARRVERIEQEKARKAELEKEEQMGKKAGVGEAMEVEVDGAEAEIQVGTTSSERLEGIEIEVSSEDVQDFNNSQFADSESETESDIEFQSSLKEEDYNNWRTGVVESASPEMFHYFAPEDIIMYHRNEPITREYTKRASNFQVESVEDAIRVIGDLGYGMSD